MNTPRPSLLPESFAAEPQSAEAWAPMLSIQRETQEFFAIRMGNLLWMEYNSSDKLMLRFSTHTIRIEGRGLTPLYEELLKLRCRTIVVSATDDAPNGATVVLKAVIDRKPGREDA